MQKHLGWDDLLHNDDVNSQHLNGGDEHEYDYGVAVQNAHEHAHHDHQKNRGKPRYDGARYRRAGSGYGVRLVFDAHAAGSAPSALSRCNEDSMHASSDRPSDVHRREVHHCGDGDNDHHDASDRLHSDDLYSPHEGQPCAHVGQNVSLCDCDGYAF